MNTTVINFDKDANHIVLESILADVIKAYQKATGSEVVRVSYIANSDEPDFDTQIKVKPTAPVCARCKQPLVGGYQVKVAGELGPTTALVCKRFGCHNRGVLVVQV